MRQYLIVGAGAAGIEAAAAIRSQDARGEILLVSDDPHGYYSRPGLAYYLAGEIPERQLFPFREADYRELNLRRLAARAVRIHTQAHKVELHDGRQLPYDRLLIASGSTAVRLGVPGSNLGGVVKLDNLADAQVILELAQRGRRAVVVGGGITALELVEGLRSRHVHTTYLLRGERYWSSVLDSTESRIVEQRLKDEKIAIQYHAELAEITGRQGHVAGVRLKDGRLFPCDLVAVAVGVRPRAELAQASNLQMDRGILTGERLQTSAPDVFAAGDAAQVFDPASGQAALDTLWGVARDEGRIAGLNMAGQTAVYEKGIPFNVTRLAGLTTTIIGQVGGGRDEDVVSGIVRGDSETWRQPPGAIAAQAGFEVNRLRLLVGEARLAGALVMGDQTLSLPLQEIIRRRIDISPIREKLLRPGAPLADIVSGFWSQWTQSHAEYTGRSPQQP